MPSALEGKALAIGDNLVNKALIELEKKICQRRHYALEDKFLRAGNVFRLGPRLPNRPTDEYFDLRPVDRRIPCRRESRRSRNSAISRALYS